MHLTEKPPLGLVPQYLAKEGRLKDVKAAVMRYIKAGLPLPFDWIDEYNELTLWLHKKAAQKPTEQ